MQICNSKIVGLTFGVGLAIAASTFAASASSVIFNDGNFNSVTVGPSFIAAGSASSAQCPTCGQSGGQGLQAINNNNGNATNNSLAVIDNLFSYTPNTEGSIISITATVDKAATFTGAGTIQNNFKPLLEQDGKYYYAQINNGSPVTFGASGGTFPYTTISDALPLTSSSFSLYDFTTGTTNNALHPNFAGDTILFGLLGMGGNPPATVSYDNLGFTLTTTPLPSTWLMLLSGFIGLGFFAYRGTKKNAAALAAA